MTILEKENVEVWPNYECKACGEGEDIIVKENSGWNDKTHKEFCCKRCGSPVTEEQRKNRPEKSQIIIKPLYRSKGVNPLNEKIHKKYNEKSFLKASKEEISYVYGIGEDLADKIVKNRDWIFKKEKVKQKIENEYPEAVEQYKQNGKKEEKLADYLYQQGYCKNHTLARLSIEKMFS